MAALQGQPQGSRLGLMLSTNRLLLLSAAPHVTEVCVGCVTGAEKQTKISIEMSSALRQSPVADGNELFWVFFFALAAFF